MVKTILQQIRTVEDEIKRDVILVRQCVKHKFGVPA